MKLKLYNISSNNTSINFNVQCIITKILYTLQIEILYIIFEYSITKKIINNFVLKISNNLIISIVSWWHSIKIYYVVTLILFCNILSASSPPLFIIQYWKSIFGFAFNIQVVRALHNFVHNLYDSYQYLFQNAPHSTNINFNSYDSYQHLSKNSTANKY